MKILLLTDRMECGGAETHIAQLATSLLDVGDEVHLLSGGGKLADALEQAGVVLHTLDTRTHNPVRLLLLRRKVLRLIKREHFDVAHAHARIPALLIKGVGRFGTLEIVTLHAHFRASFPYPLICHWGERTIAVSEDLRLYAKKAYRIPSERITVIQNGIDPRRFFPPIPDVRQEESADAPIRLLFVSRLDADCSLVPRILLRILPSLLEEFPNVRLRIAGGGTEYEALRKKALALNRRLGIDAVEMLGTVEHMSSILQTADIFIGVSRAAMEAAASECAVILAGNEGYFGILEPAVFGEALHTNLSARGCPSPTEDALLSDLCYLLHAPVFRQRCASKARQLVLTHCNATVMCEKTRALYQKYLHVKPRSTITVGGYLGCKNLGDDAIFFGMVTGLRAYAPDVRILALSGSPRADRARFGVACYHRYNPIAILFCLLRSDFFFCGGGSLLQNATSSRSLLYYLSLLRVANLFCDIGLYAAGIGPLLGARATKQVLSVLSKCRYISLRDRDSLRFLRTHGISPEHLYCGADAAFWLSAPSAGRMLTVRRASHLPRTGRYLVIVPHKEVERTSLGVLLPAAVRILCRRHRLFPVFCTFDGREDRASSHLLAKQCGGIPVRPDCAEDALALLGESELVLSMRLHGLILASVAQTPAVAVFTDRSESKLTAFCKEMGLRALNAHGISVGELVDAMEESIAARQIHAPILADCVRDMRKKAEKDLANIVGMLYNRGK
ncbi:MAG: glycosyltransferase [Clostridia bacterium]|nr:glycosyltransferase [Clostridia bacterium]